MTPESFNPNPTGRPMNHPTFLSTLQSLQRSNGGGPAPRARPPIAVDPRGHVHDVAGPGGRRIGRLYLKPPAHRQPLVIYAADLSFAPEEHPYIAAALLELAPIAGDLHAPAVLWYVEWDSTAEAFCQAVGFTLTGITGPLPPHHIPRAIYSLPL